MKGDDSIVETLGQARAGSQQAMGRLFESCRSYLSLVARAQVESRLRAKVDASDIVQQTMLEAYRDFARFHGNTEAEWLAWLRKILAHNAADFIRQFHGTDKRQARREVPLGQPSSSAAGFFEPADRGESPSQQVMRKERELQVAEAVAQLAPDYQEVIVLRNLERLAFDEIARRMGRSRPAVQMLWMRAIRKLQEVVSGEW